MLGGDVLSQTSSVLWEQNYGLFEYMLGEDVWSQASSVLCDIDHDYDKIMAWRFW